MMRPAGSGTAATSSAMRVKVMKRINNRPVAVEAVLTRNGTVVGPVHVGADRTPTAHPVPWWLVRQRDVSRRCSTEDLRRKAGDLVGRLGDRLGAEGYRGFFEVDVLVDTDTDEVYLGELNPRISGASSITNVTAGAYADIPLFAFHLLEYFDVDFELDIEEINARWRELAAADLWSQMVIKETSSVVQLITSAALTGQYSYDRSGALVYRRAALDWHQLQNESRGVLLAHLRSRGLPLEGCRPRGARH